MNKIVRIALVSTIIGAISLNIVSAKEHLIVWEDYGKDVAIKPIAEKFAKEFDCTVEVLSVGSPEQVSKYIEAKKDGSNIPDIITVQSVSFTDAMQNNILLPINFISSDHNNYIPETINAFSQKGKIFAVPRAVECLVVFYNRDILNYPFENLSDYEKFADEHKGSIYGLIGKFDNFYFSYGFIQSNGGYIFGKNPDGTYNTHDVGLMNKGTLAGLEDLEKYSEKYIPSEIIGDAGYDIMDELFLTGRAAAVVTGPWMLEKYANSGMNYGIATLPRLDNGKPFAPFFGVKGYAITESTKNKDLAEKFIQYLNKKENAIARYIASGELPPLKDVMEVGFIQNDDLANTLRTETDVAQLMPATVEMNEVWGPMNEAVREVVSHEKHAKEAFDEAYEKLDHTFH